MVLWGDAQFTLAFLQSLTPVLGQLLKVEEARYVVWSSPKASAQADAPRALDWRATMRLLWSVDPRLVLALPSRFAESP